MFVWTLVALTQLRQVTVGTANEIHQSAAVSLDREKRDSGFLDIPTLGMPFAVGMLYSAQLSQIIPSASLFSRDALESKVRRVDFPSTKYDVLESNSFKDIANALDVSAELSVTIPASGFSVTVTGAASYLKQDRKSERVARISLLHHRTSFYKYIDLSDAKQLVTFASQIEEFERKLSASHVVTEVLYGANAFIYYDYEMNDTMDVQKIFGLLKIAANIPGMGSLSATASVNLTSEEKEVKNKTLCGFVGDYDFTGSPSTINQSNLVIRNLSSSYIAVPIRAKLTPMARFKDALNKLIADIDASAMQQLSDLFEGLSRVELKVKTLLQTQSLYHLPFMLQRIRDFNEIVDGLRNQIQTDLAPLLSKLRSNPEKAVELLRLLKELKRSPFKVGDLEAWIENKKEQVNLLTKQKLHFHHDEITAPAGEVDFVTIDFITTPADQAASLFDTENKLILALIYKVAQFKDEYIEDLQWRLENATSLSKINRIGNGKSDYKIPTFDNWVNNEAYARQLAILQYQFFYFCQSNSGNQFTKSDRSHKVKCVVYSKLAEEHDIGPTIEVKLYTSGKENTFVVPSPPRNIRIEPDRDGFQITWDPPEFGAEFVASYLILYKRIDPFGVNHKDYYKGLSSEFNNEDELEVQRWTIRRTKTNTTKYFLPCLEEDGRTYFLKIRGRSRAGETTDEQTGCFGKGVPLKIIQGADRENKFGKITKLGRNIIVENAALCSMRLWNVDTDGPKVAPTTPAPLSNVTDTQ